MNENTNRTASVPSTLLFYFEFCNSNVGAWDREWFATRSEAEAARQVRAESMGTNLGAFDSEDMCGNYGDISEVHEERVELTAQGVLGFAKNFAVDTNTG